MDLFKDQTLFQDESVKPLADRMRPKSLEEFVGQEHILGEGKILRLLIEKKDLPSMILWGPSGVGKTTLGWLMGRYMKLPFISLSAVSIGVKEVKEVVQKTKAQRVILFIDEFHRFNKLQQDSFLPHVENGRIILIGATTENPSFEIIAPLLSRMRVITLKPLTKESLVTIVKRALVTDVQLVRSSLKIEDETIEEIAYLADGDARRALNLLEVCFKMIRESEKEQPAITHDIVREAYQKRIAVYDNTVEKRFLILLEVAIIRERQTFHK